MWQVAQRSGSTVLAGGGQLAPVLQVKWQSFLEAKQAPMRAWAGLIDDKRIVWRLSGKRASAGAL